MKEKNNILEARHIQWHRIISLSKQMLTMALEYNWESVAPLEEERKILIAHYFNSFEDHEKDEKFASEVKKLIHLNEQMLSIASASKEQLGEKMHSLNSGAAAEKAYRENYL